MSPRRLKLCSILSAVAWLALGGLWVFSYFGDRAIAWGDARRLTLTRGRVVYQSPARDRAAHFKYNAPGWGFLGFSWVGNEMIEPNIAIPAVLYPGTIIPKDPNTVRHYRERSPPLILCGTTWTAAGTVFVVLGWEAGVPVWFLMAIAMVLPVKWWIEKRRQRGLARIGLCKVCGYDLRASTDRCPECGTAFIRRKKRQPAVEAAQ